MYGSMMPSCRLPGAAASATPAPAWRGTSTIGRAGLVSSGRRRVDLGQPPRRGQVGGHDRERLVLAVLARPQRRDGLLVAASAARW